MKTENKSHWYEAAWYKFSRKLENLFITPPNGLCKGSVGLIKRFIYLIAKRSSEDRLAQVAGSLTFTTVLSLVPLLTVGFAIFTAFPLFASLQVELQNYFAEHLMPAQISNQIFEYLNQFSANAKSLTTVGSLALVVTSIITLMTVEAELNLIWRVHKPRPIAQRVLVYWASITLGPILLGVSFSISSYLASQPLLATHSDALIARWLLSSATLALSILALTALYVYLPNRRVRWCDALIGGVVAAIAFEAAKWGFGLYIRQFPTYTAVYGAFAAVPIFLLWVYLSWLIILGGAVLTSTLPAMRIGELQRPRFVGSDLLDALELLVSLEKAQEKNLVGCTKTELASIVQRDIETMKRLLAKLEERHWIAKLQREGKSEKWALITPVQQITLAALFDLLVMDCAKFTAQLEQTVLPIDIQKLSIALKNNKMNLTLAELIKEATEELIEKPIEELTLENSE